MESLIKDFNKLQEEFHEVVENYPILEDDFNKIFDKDIKEIEELLDKNDEYYLKKANSKLEDLIEDIKEMSEDIKDLFDKYDSLTKVWNELEIKKEINSRTLDRINNQVKKANELITSKNYKSVKEAYKLLNASVKELKEYTK